MTVRITDPFFRQFYNRLVEELDKRIHALAEGGASVRGVEGILLDPVNTAMKYEKDTAVIQAYKDIIELGLEIDREMFGTKRVGDD